MRVCVRVRVLVYARMYVDIPFNNWTYYIVAFFLARLAIEAADPGPQDHSRRHKSY